MKPEIDGRWQIALPAADGMRDDSCVSSAEDNDIRFGAAASHASPSRWPRWRSPLDDIGSENRAALMWASRRTTEEGVADLTRPGVLSVFQFPSVDTVTSGLRRIPGPSGGASTNGIHTGCLPGESDFVEAAPDVGSCSFDSTQSPIGLWRMQISAGGKRAHTANANAHTHTHTRTPAPMQDFPIRLLHVHWYHWYRHSHTRPANFLATVPALLAVGEVIDGSSWTVNPIPDFSANGSPQTDPSELMMQPPGARIDPLVWMTDSAPDDDGETETRPIFYGGYGCAEIMASATPCAPESLTDMWYFDGGEESMWRQVDMANAQLDTTSVVLQCDQTSAWCRALDIDTVWSHFGGGSIGVTTWTASIPKRLGEDREPRHAVQCLMAFGAAVCLACFRAGC
jgi:hypothetical protein